jgi:hypothetical protein
MFATVFDGITRHLEACGSSAMPDSASAPSVARLGPPVARPASGDSDAFMVPPPKVRRRTSLVGGVATAETLAMVRTC